MSATLELGQAWWETQPEGKPLALAFVKVDRVGSTDEWKELPQEEVDRLRGSYFAGVEDVAQESGAVFPLHWQGDGAMMFLAENAEQPAPARAFAAAKLIWEQVRIDQGMKVRVAVHAAAAVPWKRDTGKLSHPAIGVCGHIEQVAPVNGVAVSEDVYLRLPEKERLELEPLGVTARDGVATYVWPRDAGREKDPKAFLPGDEMACWDAFRRYVNNAPEVRRLRYAAFALQKKEPPNLDILDVFVPLEVERRRGGLEPPDLPELRREGPAKAKGRKASADEMPEEVPFARLVGRAEATFVDAFEAVFRRSRKLIVLGEPGSGKTTLLRWLAVVAAGGRLGMAERLGADERLLPLPVSIGVLAETRRELHKARRREPDVVAALARYFHARSVGDEKRLRAFLGKRLEAGECLVLLDGLDEVKADERHVVRDWLEAFAARYPRNRFVVSSRTVGFAGFGMPGAEQVTLRPFDDEQVKRYVEAFCRAYLRWETDKPYPPAEAKAAEELLNAIGGIARLHALARNPFLLSGLALIHRAEGRLPRHRVQFYELFARALCETWGTARRMVAGKARHEIAYEEEAVPILGRLAFRMHEEHPAGAAPREFVVDTLAETIAERKGADAKDARKAAEEFLARCADEVAILLERGPDLWGFLHLTFQEFFVAAGLHAAEEFQQQAMAHLFQPRWEEVIRLGVGYLAICQKRSKAAADFVRKVLAEGNDPSRPWVREKLRRQIPLAALLAAEAGDALPADLQQEIADDFIAWADHFPCNLAKRVRTEIGLTDYRDVLAPQYLARLVIDAGEEWERAALALGQLRIREAVKPLLKGLEAEDARTRGSAAEALGLLGAPEALGLLLKALTDKGPRVRERAAFGLGQLGLPEGVHPLLQAMTDGDAGVRGAAAYALGHLGEAEAVEPLLEAMKDKEIWVRWSAANALGQLGAPGIVRPLLEAITDKNAIVRASAANALGELAAQEAVGPLLEAMNDADETVRGSAARSLGKLRASQAVEAILGAIEEETPWLRWCAARALGQLGVSEAVEPLLKALDDTSPFVRLAAAASLAELGVAKGVEAFDNMLEDEKPWVRAMAADALEGIGD